MKIVLGYLLTYSYLLFILFGVEILQKRISFSDEVSRKMIHVGVGCSWFIMIAFFEISWHLVIPPLTFVFINYWSYRNHIFTSMEVNHRSSKGTIYFALSYVILSFATLLLPDFLPCYGLGAMAMTFGDGLAPFAKNLFPKSIGSTSKTYGGSIFLFLIIVLLVFCFFQFYHIEFHLVYALFISLFGTVLEFLGENGYDNLTLPLGVAFLSYCFIL